jgi:hypothetical protein
MADIDQHALQALVDETRAEDIEMESGDTAVGASNVDGLAEIEPEAPKLVLFSE